MRYPHETEKLSPQERLNIVREKAACFRSVLELPGRYINDHCLIFEDGLWHLFYCEGEVGKGAYDRGNEVNAGHAISPDLIKWSVQKPVLTVEPDAPWWENGQLAPVGTVLKHEKQYYLFYMGQQFEGAEVMCLALSDNLWHWERSPYNPVHRPSLAWSYWAKDARCGCRDAHIMRIGEDWVMYYVAMHKDRTHHCIAAATSTNLVTWQDIGPVLTRRMASMEATRGVPESPIVIFYHEQYYLFYRHGDGTKYVISKDPLNFDRAPDWYFGPNHASEIFFWNGRWYITHCCRPPDDVTSDAHRTRGLFLGGLDFTREHPEIVPL